MESKNRSLKVRPVWEIQEEYPDFEFDWWPPQGRFEVRDFTEHGIIAEHPKFGLVMIVVVCDGESGEPEYDQFFAIEPKQFAVISVPFMRERQTSEIKSVRLVRQERLAFLPDDMQFNASKPKNFSFEKFGKVFIEAPRGLKKDGETLKGVVKRETAEEAKCKVGEVKQIGKANSNTTYFARSVPIFGAEILFDLGPRAPDDATERILGYKDYSVDKIKSLIAEDKIECSLTVTALFNFFIEEGLV